MELCFGNRNGSSTKLRTETPGAEPEGAAPPSKLGHVSCNDKSSKGVKEAQYRRH
jgi:hypothetical protein